jgi:hypothetical protein
MDTGQTTLYAFTDGADGVAPEEGVALGAVAAGSMAAKRSNVGRRTLSFVRSIHIKTKSSEPSVSAK